MVEKYILLDIFKKYFVFPTIGIKIMSSVEHLHEKVKNKLFSTSDVIFVI